MSNTAGGETGSLHKTGLVEWSKATLNSMFRLRSQGKLQTSPPPPPALENMFAVGNQTVYCLSGGLAGTWGTFDMFVVHVVVSRNN